jgi:hypothetical protein
MSELLFSGLLVKELKECKKSIKELKMLCRKMTGEQLKIIDDDFIIVGRINDKIKCFCCISIKSPTKFFNNEKDANIPYLYNYICDAAYRKDKISVSLMKFIKMTSASQGYKDINLHVIKDNTKAIKFFERNSFMNVGEEKINNKDYKMFTFT